MTKCLRALAGALVALSLVISGAATAQEYPTRPITLIVPWPAGGLNDVVLRVIAEQAAKHLGQPIVIDNRAGGGGSVGPATMAATAKPDGYTFAQMPDATYRVPLMQKSPWDPEKDFTYIIGLYAYAFGLVVPADAPFKTWKDIVAHAKQNPGKLTFATPGAASSLHMGMEKLIRESGVKLVHVPFKGSLEANTAVAGGHVNMGASGSSTKPLVDAGKIRIVQMWTRARTKSFQDVPMLGEDGDAFYVESPGRPWRAQRHGPEHRGEPPRCLPASRPTYSGVAGGGRRGSDRDGQRQEAPTTTWTALPEGMESERETSKQQWVGAKGLSPTPKGKMLDGNAQHGEDGPWPAALFAPASTAFAQDYPNKPVTLVIPWVAGGPTDIVMRAVAEAAQKHLGQPIIVENKAGGGGSVGPAQMAATAKPDGYTISQMPDAVYRMQITQKTTYDSQSDFTYIIALTGYAYGVTVPANSPFKTWQDLVAFAKANPGKLNFGSPGAA